MKSVYKVIRKDRFPFINHSAGRQEFSIKTALAAAHNIKEITKAARSNGFLVYALLYLQQYLLTEKLVVFDTLPH